MQFQFKMWSPLHYIYIVSPFVILFVLWLFLRKRSDKTRYIVGVVIGVISLCIIIMRNVDIFVSGGFNPEIIPLQVCHFGNIAVFIALVFRSKTATAVAWCLNIVCAFASLVVADSLAGYASFFEITAQAYFWGHMFIVLGAVYAVMFKIVRIDFRAFLRGILCVVILLIPAIVLNSYFRNVMGFDINYFYVYDAHGIPFQMFFDLGKTYAYGWFHVNYVYTAIVLAMGIAGMTVMYFVQKGFQRLLYGRR